MMLDSYLMELRLEMAYAPRWVYVSNAEWHIKMQALYEDRVRVRLRWKEFRRMLKHAGLAGFYQSMPEGGGVHHRYNARRNQFAVITGLTS